MKKNKNTRFILLALVVVIWAGVARQIFTIKKEAAPSNFKTIKSSELTKDRVLKNQFTFSLNANYPDPFLSEIDEPSKNREASIIPRIKSNLPDKPKVEIPKIEYLGYLFSKNQKKVILKIDNRVQSYPINQKKGLIEVSFVSKDSVLVYWNGQKKMIDRSY